VSGFFQRLRAMSRRRAGGPNPIIEGPVARTLLGLSIPMIMAMFLVTGFGLVDMLYLGRFSKEAMAAVSVAFPVTYLLMTLAGALGTAATSLCSRLIGRGEDAQVRNLVLHVLLVVAGATLLVTPGGMLLLRPVIGSTGAAPEVVEDAVRYGRIIFAGTLVSLVPMSVNSLFRGEGDTIFPFKVMATALGLNVVLNPLFIFGPGPFPRLGVVGAAATTVTGFTLATVLVLRELRSRERRVRWDRAAWRFDPALLRDLAGVALPAMVATISTPISVYLINDMLADQGTEALAAFGAGIRLLSFVFLPTLGITMSMMVMVGQNHGAGRRRRVGRITLVTLGFALSLLAALALPVIAFPRQALSLFTDDPLVIAAGIPLARFVTMARPMLSVANITALWFQARGQGLAGMLPNIVMRVVMEPLGLWLGLRLGDLETGWIGMAVGGFIGGGLCGLLLLWRLRVYVAGEDRGAVAAGAG
jgi:putative MATE family efflux protein